MEHKAIPRKVRQLVYEKYQGHCAYCGREIAYKDMQVDHIMAVLLNGLDSLENLNPACRMCNYYKQTLSINGLRSKLLHLRTCLHRSFDYRLALAYGLITENENKVTFYFENH